MQRYKALSTLMLVAMLAMAMLPGCAAPTTVPPTPQVTEEAGGGPAGPIELEVYDPTGTTEIAYLFAPRLADLSGKTICELSNGGWEAARTFPVIREALQAEIPTANIIPYTEFPNGEDEIDIDEIGDIVKQAGCEAVIVGNSG